MKMLAGGFGADRKPELLLQGLGQLRGVPGALLGEFLLLMKSLISPVRRGGLPGAVSSANPSTPRCVHRSKSRAMLAAPRPV
jgi:hypothetical protein